MAGSHLWLVVVLVCCWAVMTLQEHTEELHDRPNEKIGTPTKLGFLTKTDNGVMITGLMIGYLLRNGIYWINSQIPEIEIDEEAPAWLVKEYRIFKDLQQHHKNFEQEQESSFTPKSPFMPRSFKDLKIATTEAEMDSPIMTSAMNKSVKALDMIFSSAPAPEHMSFIMDHYAENLDQLLGTTHLRELLGIIETTEENLVGYVDWVNEELFSVLGELKRLLRKRYSSGKPIGSKAEIVNAIDKLFAICWRVYSTPAILGDTLDSGVNIPGLNDFVNTLVGAVKGSLDYYQIELKVTPNTEGLPITVVIPELYRNPSAHLPAHVIKQLLRNRRNPKDAKLAKYSRNDLLKVLGKYEMEKMFVILTLIVNAATHDIWLQIEELMKGLIKVYRKTHANPAQAPNITLDIPTLKLLSQAGGEGSFGLPEDFALVIKYLGWKKSRGKRTFGGSTFGIFPEYRTIGGFWDVLTALFGYEAAVRETDKATKEEKPEEHELKNTGFQYLGEDCSIGEVDSHCVPQDERTKPIVPLYLGQPPATVTDKYVARIKVDTSLVETADSNLWDEYVETLSNLGASVVAAPTWEAARTALQLPIDYLEQHADDVSLLNSTVVETLKCVMGPMCTDCIVYVKFQFGEPLCCYACLTGLSYLKIDQNKECVCYYPSPYVNSTI